MRLHGFNTSKCEKRPEDSLNERGMRMKQTIELTCATCGVTFTAEADYFLPGISGYVANAKGEMVTFLDPTAEHQCEECIRESIGPLWKSEESIERRRQR